MVDLHTLPAGTWPSAAYRNNGPDNLAFERFKLRELAEGWPMYRDSSEWENFESIFAENAFVYTSWTGRIDIKGFMAMSQAGMDNGAFIMHRCGGVTTDITASGLRAVTKLKITVTQRFVIDGCEIDVEADCRFNFFCKKGPAPGIPAGEWRIQFAKAFYEKDKLIPTNPNKVPVLDEEKLKEYPRGYRYLAYCQEMVQKVKVLKDLPGHRLDAVEGNVNGETHNLMYSLAKRWLDGEEIEV